MVLNLYLISQTENDGYDTYDSAVVAAENEEIARGIHPYSEIFPEINHWKAKSYINCWASSPVHVTATLIGIALPETPRGVILGSFNAG